MVKNSENLTFQKNQKNLRNIQILCIGDLILDRYIFGKIERISPEAPVPILSYNAEKYGLGGVGNVAKNITSLGAKVKLIALYGNDIASNEISNLLKKTKLVKIIKIKIKNFVLPIKTRFINKTSHILRLDRETQNFKLTKIQKNKIIKNVNRNIMNCDIVILSDYNKGMLDKELIQKIIKVAHKNNKVVVADPKKINLSDYQNSDIITPNQKEITIASGKNYLSEINLIKYAQKIIKENNIKNILITRSEKGMILVNSKYIKKYKAIAKAATDVTGAGDTVIAVLSTMIAAGFEISSAVKISNNAASIVIKKIGTATTSIVELNNLSK